MAAALAAFSCIERSNPFDPINSGNAKILSVRDQLRPGLEARAAGEDAYGPKLLEYDSAFRSDSSANAKIMDTNEVRKSTNSNIGNANASIVAANATAPVESLKLQQVYLFLYPLANYGHEDLDRSQGDLRAQTANLALFMSQANAANSPATIYPAEFSDSVLAPFVRDSAAFTALRMRIDAGNRQVDGYNGILEDYDSIQADANKRVREYNDTIYYRKTVSNHPVFVQADSLDAGTKGAEAGDTLFIGQGIFNVDLRFNHSGTADKAIVVRGYPGGKTILQATNGSSSAMILSANANIRFQDIVFKGGVKLEHASNNVFFNRCTFTGSGRFGIDVADSHVELSDCQITDNPTGGSFSFTGDTNQVRMRLDNVLIAHNTDDGLHLTNPSGELRNCTISDNGGDGIELIVQRNGFAISNSIITGNRDLGIYRQRTTEWPQQPDVQYCDLWGNQQGDWSLGGLDSTAIAAMKSLNFSVQPDFINPGASDYGLQPGSTIYELEHQTPPLKVGYRP